MQNAISINMALTMAGPKPPSRTTSLRTIRPVHNMNRPASSSSQSVSLYNGVSDRPLGWKPRRSARNPGLGSTAKDMNIKRWDGAARLSSEWDGLRKVIIFSLNLYMAHHVYSSYFLGPRIMVPRWKLSCPPVRPRSIQKRSCFQSSHGSSTRDRVPASHQQILGQTSDRVTRFRCRY